MSELNSPLAGSIILKECEDSLIEGGYAVTREADNISMLGNQSLLAEDAFGVVAVIVFETVTDLLDTWSDAQGALVEFLSAKLNRPDPKLWEGYLVLMTPGSAGSERMVDLDRIRYDTTRVRKLIATGDELTTLSEVRRFLRPLLPLEVSEIATEAGSLLDALPDILVNRGLDGKAIEALIKAFKQQDSLVPSLHRFLEGQKKK